MLRLDITNTFLFPGLYTGVLFILLFLQPDFGSAVIIFLVLALVWCWYQVFQKDTSSPCFLQVCWAFVFLWSFVFADYQKERIKTFVNPLTDLQGAGYNAYQSTIAVGSGQLFGKGVGIWYTVTT